MQSILRPSCVRASILEIYSWNKYIKSLRTFHIYTCKRKSRSVAISWLRRVYPTNTGVVTMLKLYRASVQSLRNEMRINIDNASLIEVIVFFLFQPSSDQNADLSFSLDHRHARLTEIETKNKSITRPLELPALPISSSHWQVYRKIWTTAMHARSNFKKKMQSSPMSNGCRWLERALAT